MAPQASLVKGTGVVVRLFGTIFFLVFFAAGLAAVSFIGKQWWTGAQPYRWSEMPATVLASRIESGPERREGSAYVQYRYTFEGRTHVSERIDVDDPHPNGEEMLAFVQRLTPGSTATCYVNPKAPHEAVLRRQSLWFGLVVLFPMIFVLVGVAGLVGLWSPGVFSTKRPAPVTAIARRDSRNRGAVYFLFGIFALVGGVLTYLFGVLPLVEVVSSRGWRETPCQIVSSEVRHHSDSDGTTYSVQVRYRYRLDGRELQGNRFSFVRGTSSGYESKAQMVAKYPPGLRTVCYVNPKDPVQAVLVRSLRWEMLIGLFPLLFFAIGVGGLVWTARSGTSPSRLRSGPGQGGLVLAEAATGPLRGPGGKSALKARSTRLGKFVGLLFVCLFWNGIVSVFLVVLVNEWMRGQGSWFLSLFLTPFVLVGLALLVGVAYQFLALFSPSARLTLSASEVRIGDVVEIEWRIARHWLGVSELTILFEGQEEATYRQGTSTATDKETFYRDCVVRTNDAGAIASGKGTLRIPPNAMHSFSSRHNKIVWCLNVKGAVPRWPDVAEDYELHVLPKASV